MGSDNLVRHRESKEGYWQEMTTETDIQNRIVLALCKIGTTMFRNNVGVAEKVDKNTGKKYWVRFGLCEGSSDLIGITPVTVTQDMVGKKLGVFTAVEVKKDVTKAYAKHRMETQQRFIDFVNKNGGFAFKSDDPSKAVDKIKDLVARGGFAPPTSEI